MKPRAKLVQLKSHKNTTKADLFETISCSLCGSKKFSIVYRGTFPEDLSEDFLRQVYRSSSDNALFEQVVKCGKCGLIYLNPRLKSDLIIDSYAEGEDQSFISQDPMRVRTFTQALKELSKKYDIPLNKKTKLLDIGCAGGAFLRAAKSLGLSTIGIEPNRWLSQYARTKYKLDVRAGVLADFKFPNQGFDVISMWDVIEHVPAPKDELRRIYQLLKPNGLLVINYPDISSLPAKFLKRKWPFLLSVHLTYYTPETITKQLAEAGFEVLSIKPHWQTLEFGYVLKRITPYFAVAGSVKKLVEKIGLGNLPIKYWIGQTQVVARNVDRSR